MHRQMFIFLTVILVVVLAGCGEAPAVEPATQAVAAQEPTEEPTEAPEATDESTEVPEATPRPTSATTSSPAQATTPGAQPSVGGRLQTVIQRGNLICGVNGGLAGFSNLEADGTTSGFDADFCRVVAVAIFGDPESVEFVPLSAQERFPAVQAGTVDVLFRNTTWTVSRDSSVLLDFGPVTFYDGQGIMTREAQNVTSLEDLADATICVQSGTTTELNLTDQFRARNIAFTPLVFESIDATYTAYGEERCDAVTSDRSQLIARRTTLANPDDHVILDDVLSKEPLAPAVAQGDSQWRDVVSWAVYATIQAEEFGINSTNTEEFLDSENPDIRRFMGVEGDLGVGLGLENDFTVQIIQEVGNYAEIYDRNLGPGTPFDLERGINAPWTNGGLLYSPPFR